MITRLEQLRKFKKASFLRNPIDEWTCDKLVHPERSSLSSFIILEKSGVSVRYLELLKSTLLKLGKLCEKRMNNHLLASNLKTSISLFLFQFGMLSKLKTYLTRGEKKVLFWFIKCEKRFIISSKRMNCDHSDLN